MDDGGRDRGDAVGIYECHNVIDFYKSDTVPCIRIEGHDGEAAAANPEGSVNCLQQKATAGKGPISTPFVEDRTDQISE